MLGVYKIFQDGQPVGKVEVSQQGLYYHFSAHCDLLEKGIFELVISAGNVTENLGVLAPKAGCFGLETNVAAKRLGTSMPEFHVRLRYAERKEKFIPLRSNEPFCYLSQLKEARTQIRDGQLGVLLSEIETQHYNSNAKATGQWSDPRISECIDA